MAEKQLLGTMTGEYFQPVRLHYRVFDRQALLRAFERLRCVARDPTQDRWVWLYDHEARELRFKQPLAQIPEHLQPIILGSFYLRANDRLLLDLRSHERAVQAVPFFDKHVPRAAARAEEVEVVNKLFSTEDPTITPDRIFDNQQSTVRDPEAAVREVTEHVAGIPPGPDKLRSALAFVQARAKQPLPELERFPIHFDEEGIQGLVTNLSMRQLVAMQHWLGNTNYSMYDVIQAAVRPK